MNVQSGSAHLISHLYFFMSASLAPHPVHRNRVTKNEGQIIWRTCNTQGDAVAKQLCSDLGYSESTFYSIIRKEGRIEEAYKTVKQQTKWTSEHFEVLRNLIPQHPTVTLKEMLQQATQNGCPQVSISTLSSYLERL
jgi:transposase